MAMNYRLPTNGDLSKKNADDSSLLMDIINFDLFHQWWPFGFPILVQYPLAPVGQWRSPQKGDFNGREYRLLKTYDVTLENGRFIPDL